MISVVPTLVLCAVLTSLLAKELKETNVIVMYLHDIEKNWSSKKNGKEKNAKLRR
jgi:hypothetical protein